MCPIPAVDLSDLAAMKYEGGKSNLRPWLARFIPGKGRAYVEPFAGRGHVFFLMGNIGQYERWQLNDMRTGTPDGFLNALLTVDVSDIPMHIKMSDEQYWKDQRAAGTPIGLIMECVTCRNSQTYDVGHGFQGSGHICHGAVKDGVYGNYTKQGLARRVLLARDVITRCSVEITCLNYTQLPWDKYTSEDFVYLDPPYLNAQTQCYSDRDIDPGQFVHILKRTKARWLLSEYEQPIYNKAFGRPVAEYNAEAIVSKGLVEGRPYRKEVLYANFPIKFRPIRFLRKSEALASTLDILKECGPAGMTMDNMERRLLSMEGMRSNWVKAEMVNLKYHPYVLFNGLKYWWMGR